MEKPKLHALILYEHGYICLLRPNPLSLSYLLSPLENVRLYKSEGHLDLPERELQDLQPDHVSMGGKWIPGDMHSVWR